MYFDDLFLFCLVTFVTVFGLIKGGFFNGLAASLVEDLSTGGVVCFGLVGGFVTGSLVRRRLSFGVGLFPLRSLERCFIFGKVKNFKILN